MCLILFALQPEAEYPLILAANRDEYYQRPTRSLDYWPEYPGLLAGKDLQQGGTWLGITQSGRFAALTNYRDGGSQIGKSRGLLTLNFLVGDLSAKDYLSQLRREADQYPGFNLLVGDLAEIYYFSNRQPERPLEPLPPGLYGLSNHLLNTAWPKVIRGLAGFEPLLTHPDEEALMALLCDSQTAAEEQLPSTGVSREVEQMLSPIFIRSPLYGSRASTLLIRDRHQQLRLVEQTYGSNGTPQQKQGFSLQLGPSP